MELNKVICGDSKTVLETYESECVDLVITDPPYLLNYRDRAGRSLKNDDNAGGVLPVFDEIARVMKRDSLCISFYGWNAISDFSNKWREVGLKPVGHIVWQKPYVSNRRYVSYAHESAYILAKGNPKLPADAPKDVQDWRYSGNRLHPTEKDVDILAPLIRAFSKPGDLVLDPFMGAGSTPVAASLLDRQYVGIELEEKYCVIAGSRLDGVERYKSQAA